MEKLPPLIIQQGAVGLQRVVDAHARLAMLLLEFHCAPEKVQPHKRRFAPLPGKGDVGDALGRNVLPRVFLQQVIGHAEATAGVHALLGEKVTILAVQIADGPTGLQHDVEGRWVDP